MNDRLKVHATVASNLRARGFASLTPVQEAILAGGSSETDKLVSARTGSGKTVAYGLAIVRRLLRDGEPFVPAKGPRALVLAPTRELARQVSEELGWLIAGTGVRIGACTGGGELAAERAELTRGLDIIVGTPGRVRDHLGRGWLCPDAIECVVLDEADDMLDFGFREDLDAILGATPADRQTLMISATITPKVELLAARFQVNALRIDIGVEPDADPDIVYQGILVAGDERDKAVVNVLCLHMPTAALVFCGRRSGVPVLARHLSAKGFNVVELSGDLLQRERDVAIASMRKGEAQVCVATDVAARGLDLPKLDLVIHADLPRSVEALLHRSGRTGRAGRKGLVVLVVPRVNMRRFREMMARAKLAVDWVQIPGHVDIERQKRERMLSDVARNVAAPESGEFERLAIAGILEALSPEEIAKALYRLWNDDQPLGEEVASRSQVESALPGGGVWFRLDRGTGGKEQVRTILPMICRIGKIGRRDIGRIRVMDGETFFEVRGAVAPGFVAAAALSPEGGAHVRRMADAPPPVDRSRPRGH